MKDFITAKKNILISIAIIIASAVTLIVMTTLGRDNIYANTIASTTPRGIDDTMVYQIEDVYEDGKDWVVKGISFLIGTDSQDIEWKFQLINMENNKNYPLKLEMVDRPEVNEYYRCEYDYTRSGFIGRVSKWSVDLSKGKYQLARNIGGLNYETLMAYINEGKPTSIDPVTYASTELPDMGSDLEKIVKEGVCKVYRPDVGCYVYQLGKDIYWVADNNFNFVEGGTYMQFQMNTTQEKYLPIDRIENGWFWSNIGDYFENHELMGDFGDYRVSRRELPTEYSLTNIWTGYNDGVEWVWGADFFNPEINTMVKM